MSSTSTSAPRAWATRTALMPTIPAPSTVTRPRSHAGHAAEEEALPAALLLEQRGADLRGQAAGHLAHRREHRERAVGVLDGLVGDGDDVGGAQACVSAGAAARCRYVKSICPGRRQPTSRSLGSFTFTISSGLDHDLLGDDDPRAGLAIGLVGKPLPTPAPCSTQTSWPCRTSCGRRRGRLRRGTRGPWSPAGRRSASSRPDAALEAHSTCGHPDLQDGTAPARPGNRDLGRPVRA